MEMVGTWAKEMILKTPSALKLTKYPFNAAMDNIYGISPQDLAGLSSSTEEATEGISSIPLEKNPHSSKYRKLFLTKMARKTSVR